jgi:hypothetical protein
MRRAVMAILAVVLVAGCAGSRGSASVAHFARGIGVATGPEAVAKSHQVLSLHQFEIEREEELPSLYIETRWRNRTPFEDESALGVEAAQVRALVRGRSRSPTSSMGELYTVDMTIEQRVRVRGTAEWAHVTATDSARAFAARIVEDLRRELDVGVRRF